MVFEEFEFAAYRRTTGPVLNAYNDIRGIFKDPSDEASGTGLEPAECVVVVDSGHSHTTVTPLYKGRPIQQAIRRLEIGGKFLTNVLKEQLSVRQVDVRDETHMINRMKETACFVSRDFRADMDRMSANPLDNSIVVNYVMPDYLHRQEGEVRPYDPAVKKQMSRLGFVQNAQGQQESLVTLGTERFAVPELLFNPADIGMQQTGIPETIMHSLSSVPTGLWATMLANVLVVGGNAGFQGFTERLRADLRALAPVECSVRVERAPDYIKSTWLGGARLGADRPRLKEVLVTRQDYLENGSTWLAQVFADKPC